MYIRIWATTVSIVSVSVIVSVSTHGIRRISITINIRRSTGIPSILALALAGARPSSSDEVNFFLFSSVNSFHIL